MSNLLTMEFVQALNPLYAFPIVAVILCAFIVYAFGFKSPVQPPSFEGIEEEKKVTKKRKPKETSKGKVVQNGKSQNGCTTTKTQVSLPAKKKDTGKTIPSDKPIVEKAVNEKKAIKKSKVVNEKKTSQEKKKKESVPHEDAGEDGWVQLVSKKGRKSRKKDEVATAENQAPIPKAPKISQIHKSDVTEFESEVSNPKQNDTVPSEETPKSSVEKDLITDKKIDVEDEKNADVSVEHNKDKVTIEVSKIDSTSLEAPEETTFKSGKLIEETSNKSKKKKKKGTDVIHVDNDYGVTPSESSVEHLITELPAPQNTTNNASIVAETPLADAGKEKETQEKESKSSNVVFDELAGLYPEQKEQRKKKRVRRDH